MGRVVVVDPLLADSRHGLVGNELSGDHELIIPRSWSAADVTAAAADADVLLTAVRPVTADLMAASPTLGLVAKPGAGIDNIDVAEANRRGILVCNAPGTRGQAVAEYVTWAMLDLAKWTRPSRTGSGPRLPLDLAERTLGLVGLGDIGSRVARIAHALGMPVIAATPSRTNRSGVDVRFTDLSAIHAECDVLVLCAPLTQETTGLIDRTRLEQMRPDAILINVARGRFVVTDDLAAVMAAGHLHGAALDVTDPEPLPSDHPLRALPNVLLTPHVAGRTAGAQRRALATMIRNVLAYLSGERPSNAVNADEVSQPRSPL